MITYVVNANVLLRYLIRDDERQFAVAKPYFISKAHNLYLPIHVLCEVVWLMKNILKIPRHIIIQTLLDLISSSNFCTDKQSFDKGMVFLQNGGDFADGVIADFACRIDNAILLTFDKNGSKTANKFNIPNLLL